MAQLKNQDPTKPMDSTEYVGQLATFLAGRAGDEDQHEARLAARLELPRPGRHGDRPHPDLGRRTQTGTVQSVRVTSDGALARLTSGQDVLLTSGVVIQ